MGSSSTVFQAFYDGSSNPIQVTAASVPLPLTDRANYRQGLSFLMCNVAGTWRSFRRNLLGIYYLVFSWSDAGYFRNH